MLTDLNVKNLATLSSVGLELESGFIAITGDTGAGKSLVLDALELALGARADSTLVRQGTNRAQVTANFDITYLDEARLWLANNEIEFDDELILRRTLTSEGRSRAFVNGVSITTSQLKSLAECIVLLHTQHANQKLLQPKHQLKLLDNFSDQGRIREEYAEIYDRYTELKVQLATLREDAQQAIAERELLTFQVDELNELNLTENELGELDQEQNQLSSGDFFNKSTEEILARLDNENGNGLIEQVNRITQILGLLTENNKELINAEELIGQTQIALSEIKGEVQRAKDRFDPDPARLFWVEDRLSQIFQLARKHKVEPEKLFAHHQALVARLDGMRHANERIPELEYKVSELFDQAKLKAETLSSQRRRAAFSLSEIVTSYCQSLGMEHAYFDIRFEDHDDLTPHGLEAVQFFFQPNPGQSGGTLSKIASGGELSRVSLAIQVATASKLKMPTLVFDEVDVGIGGRTATKVGELLRDLSANSQVLVVTHQPQVAGKATAHLHVQKHANVNSTQSEAKLLTKAERIEEISKMLGGYNITDETRKAALQLLHH